MSKPILYSVIESRIHPRFSTLYQRLGIEELLFSSTRKAMAQIKKQPPDYLVADFHYGYSNNYAGVNISNLDVMLMAMQRYAPFPRTKVIVVAAKHEMQYVSELGGIYPLCAVLQYPVTELQMEKYLN
ncbi:MAG TPA: hypothetical protein ENJ33_05695 [Thiothrix sp.]|nr:hypothetical protein [Thiothrix sp.]